MPASEGLVKREFEGMTIDPGLMFKIVECNPAPFDSTRGALAWARENGVIGRMLSDETGGKGVVNISEEHPDWRKDAQGVRRLVHAVENEITICIAYAAMMILGVVYRARLTLKRYSQTGTSKAYAYRVNEIEVLPGTLCGRPKLATNPTGSTSICATNFTTRRRGCQWGSVARFRRGEEGRRQMRIFNSTGEKLYQEWVPRFCA